MKHHRAMLFAAAWLLVAGPAVADVVLGAGETITIGSARVLSAPNGVPTLGSEASGAVEIRAAGGETITGLVGGEVQWATSVEADWSSTAFVGEVVAESFRTYGPSLVTSALSLDERHSTVMVETLGTVVDVTLPGAEYHPGRRYTVKRLGSAGAARLLSVSDWNDPGGPLQKIDAGTMVLLKAPWSVVTVESTGQAWVIVSARGIE